MFIKYFSQKPLTEELIKAKRYIEDNIDELLKQLNASMNDGDTQGFNRLLHELIMCDDYLSREDVELSKDVKEKIYSFILGPSRS